MDVILASQAHQVPQVGFPQIDPVTSAMILNTKPEGAKLFEIKKKFLIFKIYPITDKNVMTEKIPRHIQAAGTWTYIILTEWLCL